MMRNKKETSTGVKKENKKKVTKKPVELKGRTNTKTVASKRPNVAPAPQAIKSNIDNMFDTISDKITKMINKEQSIVDNDSHADVNYVRVGDLETPLSGTITTTSSTGFTYYENGNIGIKNSSGNTATNIEKLPFTNPEFPNMWGGGQVGYIAPVKLKEDTLLTFLNSIESELIELNNKMGELASRNVNSLYNLTYQELFEIKKHLAETVQKHHYPGSTGNIYMMQAQRRYEIIVSKINNKLNVLFGDV